MRREDLEERLDTEVKGLMLLSMLRITPLEL